jgi:hypothetical protein
MHRGQRILRRLVQMTPSPIGVTLVPFSPRVFAILVIANSLLADVCAAFLDPRVCL